MYDLKDPKQYKQAVKEVNEAIESQRKHPVKLSEEDKQYEDASMGYEKED